MKKLLLLLLVLLMGCAPPLKEGKVIKKEMIPAHNHTHWRTIGKIHQSYRVHVPDKWWITIEGKINGKTYQEEHSFPQSFYDSINIGDILVREETDEYFVSDKWSKK